MNRDVFLILRLMIRFPHMSFGEVQQKLKQIEDETKTT